MSKKRKCPSEINTTLIRVNVGDYAALREVSRRFDLTMAEVVHMVLEGREAEKRVSPAQIPLASFRVPTSSVIAVNGNKHSSFNVKAKGGVISE